MPRSGEGARRRLQQAALELFRERGYEQTTASEIAERAGVTERTFFRHFADKREVLFDGQARLQIALSAAIAEAPEALKPLETLCWAFQSVEQLLEDNRPFSVPRHTVIASNPALQERELAKAEALIETLTSLLRQRGVSQRVATLAAQTGMATFRHAIMAWFGDPSSPLGVHLDRAFEDLRALSSSLAASEVRRLRQEHQP